MHTRFRTDIQLGSFLPVGGQNGPGEGFREHARISALILPVNQLPYSHANLRLISSLGLTDNPDPARSLPLPLEGLSPPFDYMVASH